MERFLQCLPIALLFTACYAIGLADGRNVISPMWAQVALGVTGFVGMLYYQVSAGRVE